MASWMTSVYRGSDSAWLVSSMRRMNLPAVALAASQLWYAVRAVPRWKNPLGEGAMRVTWPVIGCLPVDRRGVAPRIPPCDGGVFLFDQQPVVAEVKLGLEPRPPPYQGGVLP